MQKAQSEWDTEWPKKTHENNTSPSKINCAINCPIRYF